ncbi:hypothetical protein N7454_006250 [Penicillium verhagenii]|nr:hypothetical protein N7454_006250 [Penicillium verhagenii]
MAPPKVIAVGFQKFKTTVVLSLKSDTNFVMVKEHLLKALLARGIEEINGDRVPKDSSVIDLGMALSRYDLSQGFERLEVQARNTLADVRIRSGDIMAFRFLDPDVEVDPKMPFDAIVATIDDGDESVAK